MKKTASENTVAALVMDAVAVEHRLVELKARRQQLAFDVQNGAADPAALEAVEHEMYELTRDVERAELAKREAEQRAVEARIKAERERKVSALGRCNAIRDELDTVRLPRINGHIEALRAEIQSAMTLANEGAALSRQHELEMTMPFTNVARTIGGRISWVVGVLVPLSHPGAVHRLFREGPGTAAAERNAS